MYLSYSGFKTFLECRRAYDHKYVLKTPLLEPDNRVHMLYGDAVGKLFETFYEDQLWRERPQERMLALVRPTMQAIVAAETKKGGVFNWKEPRLKKGTRSFDEVEQEVLATVPRGLQTIKHHRLLGPGAKAELVLDVVVDGHKIAGRADFVLRRVQPHGDLVLLDGKGSRWREKYTNHRQLRWYAMQYWLKFGAIPDRLGFLYWRYGATESVDWSEVKVRELEDLKNAVLGAIGEIEKAKKELVQLGVKANRSRVFWPTPGNDCKLCSYLPLCPEGVKALSEETKQLIAEASDDGVEEGGVSF